MEPGRKNERAAVGADLLRPLGSPLTLGMSGLAIVSLVPSGVELHWTPLDQTAQAGLVLIAVPFGLQLIACILSYMARDGATAGAAVGVLATSWLAIGLVHIVGTPGVTSGTLGLLLVTAAGVLFASASAMASTNPSRSPGHLRRGGAAVRDGRRLPAQHSLLLGTHRRPTGAARHGARRLCGAGLRTRGPTPAAGTTQIPPRARRSSNTRWRRQRPSPSRHCTGRARNDVIGTG